MAVSVIVGIVKAVDGETFKVARAICGLVLKVFKPELLLGQEMTVAFTLETLMDDTGPVHLRAIVELALDKLDLRTTLRVMCKDEVIFELVETIGNELVDCFEVERHEDLIGVGKTYDIM
jgi:hypothetical protein